jgi:hypothetical protein
VADSSPVQPEPVNSSEDLNPLLNPLLEQNLSRWARIYFTTPPEARDQAVRGLLRQLRIDVDSNAAPVSVSTPQGAAALTTSVCSNCKSENAPEQQFCGFCGAPMDREQAARAAGPRREAAPPARELPHVETMSFLGLDSNQGDHELQFLREKSFGSEYYGDDSAPHRGRYAMAVIVIILAGLAYVKWPYLRSHLQSSANPAPVVQAPGGAGSDSAQAAVPTPSQPQPAASNEIQPQAVSPPARPASSAREEAAPDTPDNAGHSAAPVRPLTLAAHTDGFNAPPDGTQELLQAQRYLGGRGVAHDSRQAAGLLWKAVSKQNTRADVLLADLYLRGDGVAKSCDQARLLLVAAAKKSAPGATEKLRNLESSGCQ